MTNLNSHFPFTLQSNISNENFDVSYSSEFSLVICCPDEFTVNAYEVEDKKLKKSWTFTQKQKCTSPAIYNPHDAFFYVVQNEKILRQWKYESEDVNKSKKIKFAQPVRSILGNGASEPIILFKNGSVKLLSSAIASSKDDVTGALMSDSEKIQSCEYVSSGQRSFACVISKSEKATKRFLHVIGLDDKKSSKKILIGGKEKEPLAYCVVQDADDPYLLSLNSCGQLHKHHLFPLSDKQPVAMGQIILPTSTRKRIGMKCIDSTHIVIAGVPDPENNTKYNCIIWNTKFCTVEATQMLPSCLSSNRLCVTDDLVIMACNNGIIGMEYTVERSKLANVVGKCLSTSENCDFPVVSWKQKKKKADDGGDIVPKSSSYLISSTKISELIEAGNRSELLNCVQELEYVNESDLVDLLQFVLSLNDEDISLPNKDGDLYDSSPLSQDKSVLLNHILSLSFSEIFIVQHLRKLSLKNSVLLLRYLYYLIANPGNMSGSSKMSKITDWIMHVLDSHFVQFVSTTDPEVINLLSELTKIVQKQFEFCEQVVALDQQLSIIEKKCELPKPQSNSLYSIHILQL